MENEYTDKIVVDFGDHPARARVVSVHPASVPAPPVPTPEWAAAKTRVKQLLEAIGLLLLRFDPNADDDGAWAIVERIGVEIEAARDDDEGAVPFNSDGIPF